jgi:predicted secreted protein
MPSPATPTRGTTLSIGDGAEPEVFLHVGRVFSVGEVKPTMETIDVTDHDSPAGYREHIAGLRDGGNVEVQYRFVGGEAGQAALQAAHNDGQVRKYRITFPEAVGKRGSLAALVTASGTSEAPVEGVLNGTATLKISGQPVLEDAA